MSPEDIRKLLGGYATGTLTTEEQEALFAAALEDQELFDALAREQSLRDLLRDPAARAELLGALDTPATRPGGFWQWLRRPMVAGLATAGVAALAIAAVWQGTRLASVKHQAQPVIGADLKPPELPPAPSAAQPPPPASQPATNTRDKDVGALATVIADKENAPAVAPPSPRSSADSPASLLKEKKAVIASAPSPARHAEAGTPSRIAAGAAAARADKKTAVAMAPPLRQFDAGTLRAKIAPAPAPIADNKAMAEMAPPPPPAAVPAPLPPVLAPKAEADAASPVPGGAVTAGALQANVPLDARALFYLRSEEH